MRMVSVTALSVLHAMCILCLHLLVDGQVNVPSCTQLKAKRIGGLCFNFYPSEVTWYQAKRNCEVDGMTLAYISSRQQIIEIALEINKDSDLGVEDIVWIGASDEKKEGEFVWVASNEKASELEKLWFTGEPSDISQKDGSDEDCVGLYRKRYVNDAPCNSTFPYLCIENVCPYDLEGREIRNTSLTLSWKPGFNGGMHHNFTLFFQNLRTNEYILYDTLPVPRVTQTSSLAIYYFAWDLPTKTPYKIYIEASNGKTKCPPLTLITQTTGPPECPVNITILEVAKDHVSLSWEPGEEDKLHRTYIILAHNMSVFKNISLEGVSVGRVYTNNYTSVMYTVGNLSELTQYTFSVDVENNFGNKKCKDNFIQVTTTSGLQKSSFPAWLIFLLIFIPLVLATGVAGFFVYKRKANRAKALQMNTFPASFKKSDHESIYHTVEEAAVAMIRDSDDGHGYDLTIDEPNLQVFKSNIFKRESIAPLPPPRSSEKNKLITICSDVSQYDVCGAHDIDQPYMKINNSTSQNIVSLREEDNNIIENDVVLISVNKGDNNSLHKSFGNQNKIPESAGINSSSNKLIEFKNNTKANSSPLIAENEAYQGCYSLPLIRSDAHLYAPLTCVDSRMVKEQDHNAYDEQREEHANGLTDKKKIACDFKKEIDEIEKSRVLNVELTDQAYNSDNSMYIPPMLSNFVIEKDFAMRDDDSNESGVAGDIISSNRTKFEDNEYITPLDSETYPMMFNGDEIGTEPEDINKENWYLKIDGEQCKDDIQMKPGCEKKEEYMTWDGGEVSCDKDVLNNYIPIFASSSRQVVLDENSRKAEPAANQCVDNFKVGNSEIQEEVLVYWTPDGTKKRTFDVAKQLSSDEYSATNDYLKNY
ncbi:unnamed protein product [Lymnaea stagnalis]|uniref:C-type lectin domain-containing protein n=1 Tax=Lymnaea stagnalis TaxID=6523 RepID=A0AAV2I760_LYMST